MTLYTQEAVNDLMKRYEEKDECFNAWCIEGCLVDNYIIEGKHLKTTIIKEHYLNEWSSCYEIRMYNKTPQKYENVINALCDDDMEKAIKLFWK